MPITLQSFFFTDAIFVIFFFPIQQVYFTLIPLFNENAQVSGFERALKSLIHRKWLSLPSLTTKTLHFRRFLLLLGGKTDFRTMYTVLLLYNSETN